MNTADGIRQGIYSNSTVRRITQWLDVVPHPLIACEIAPEYVAAARWARAGGELDSIAVEPLTPGAIAATAVETNIINQDEVRGAVGKVFARLHAKPQTVALLLPDPVIRVFVLHFDVFPRSAGEAVPLLKWRLKKSVPFETDETLISFMRQSPREEGVDIVTGLARLRIIREYEQLLDPLQMYPGVVMSSTLSAVPLLNDTRPALLARVAGDTLTTAIVRDKILCGYRCIELPTEEAGMTPKALLDEIYPLAAYYQDLWQEGIASMRIAGLGARTDEFLAPLERELGCPVSSLLKAAVADGQVGADLQPLVERDLDALVGWTLNRGI